MSRHLPDPTHRHALAQTCERLADEIAAVSREVADEVDPVLARDVRRVAYRLDELSEALHQTVEVPA